MNKLYSKMDNIIITEVDRCAIEKEKVATCYDRLSSKINMMNKKELKRWMYEYTERKLRKLREFIF